MPKPSPYRKWSNVELELQEIIDSLGGRFPERADFVAQDKLKLHRVIVKYHGLEKTRKRLGFPPLVNPMSRWKDFDLVKEEFFRIEAELGHTPALQELRDLGHSSLAKGIYRYHDGYQKVRAKLGNPPKQVPQGTWMDIENVKAKLSEVMESLDGRFPTAEELRELGLSGMRTTINRYHGGKHAVAALMGIELDDRPHGFWQKWENCETILKPIVDELGHLPSQIELSDRDLSGLSDAIRKKYGGWAAVSIRMGLTPSRNPPGYWAKWENVEAAMLEAIGQLGHFPTYNELVEMKMTSLNLACVKYFGGLKEVERRLGCRPISLLHIRSYFPQIAKVYMKVAVDGDTFIGFIGDLKEKYPYEKDLKEFLEVA